MTNNRRDFLRTAAGVASSSVIGMTAASYSRVLGANDSISLALIGAGDRGTHDMTLFMNRPEVRVTAVCDVYGAHIERAKQKAPHATGFDDHRARPNGDVLIGHRSAQASHLGSLSYVQRRRIDFDPVREEILPL